MCLAFPQRDWKAKQPGFSCVFRGQVTFDRSLFFHDQKYSNENSVIVTLNEPLPLQTVLSAAVGDDPLDSEKALCLY